jgi:hypothetical protein
MYIHSKNNKAFKFLKRAGGVKYTFCPLFFMDKQAWEALASDLKEKASWKCQSCGMAQGALYPEGKKVFLTVAHLDQQSDNHHPGNLKVLCYRCHFAYDRPYNAARRKFGKNYQNVQQLKLWNS